MLHGLPKLLPQSVENVALLLAAQTAGALAANPLWGWWGDRLGKLSLMRGIAIARTVPPLVLLGLLTFPIVIDERLAVLAAIFFVLGAIANGLTIAVIGLLMEISPDNRRPELLFQLATEQILYHALADGVSSFVTSPRGTTVIAVISRARVVSAAR